MNFLSSLALFMLLLGFGKLSFAQEICSDSEVRLPVIDESISDILELTPGDHQFELCMTSLCGAAESLITMGNYNVSIASSRKDSSQLMFEDEESALAHADEMAEVLASSSRNVELIFSRIQGYQKKDLHELPDDFTIEHLLKKPVSELVTQTISNLGGNQLDFSNICKNGVAPCEPFLAEYFEGLNLEFQKNPIGVVLHLRNLTNIDLEQYIDIDALSEQTNNFILSRLGSDAYQRAQVEYSKLYGEKDSSALDRYESLLGHGLLRGDGNTYDNDETFQIQAHNFCANPSCRNGVTTWHINRLKDIKKTVDSFFSHNASSILAGCVSAFSSKISVDQRVQLYVKRTPELMDYFVDSALHDFSSSTKEEFRRFYRERLNVYGGSTLEDDVENEFATLQDRLNREAQTISELSIHGLIEKAEALSEDLSSHFSNSCDFESDPLLRRDSFLGNKDGLSELKVSYFSCHHAETGDQVFFHEMAHALSFFMLQNGPSEESVNHFLKQRSCITSNFSDIDNLRIAPMWPRFDGDLLYTEEDHADSIAYLAARNYKALFSCSFLKVSKNRYYGLGFSPMGGNSHSNSATRVLREAIFKNVSLSKACHEVIKRAPGRLLNRCR